MAVTNAHGIITSGGCILWSANPKYPDVNYDVLWLETEYDISPEPNQVAYHVQLRFRLATNKVIHYSGLHASVTVKCNNTVIATPSGSEITSSFKLWTTDAGGSGEWSTYYDYVYPVSEQQTRIEFSCRADMYQVQGSRTNEFGGPDAVSYDKWNDENHYHFRWVTCTDSVNVEGIVIGVHPTLSLSVSKRDLESLDIDWSADIGMKSLSYWVRKLNDDNSYTDLTASYVDAKITNGVSSGTFSTSISDVWLDPKCKYQIWIKGYGIDEKGGLDSKNEPSVTDITLDKSHITAISACTFGLPIDITIEGESEKHHKLKIWTEGNNLLPTFVFDDLEKGKYTFTPTQEQLDKMYRSIPNAGNVVPIHYLLTTHGDHLDWNDDQVDKTMTLTGIAKTAHVGDASNRPRRCQVWIGDAENKPRRVVMWVGDAEKKPRRTI